MVRRIWARCVAVDGVREAVECWGAGAGDRRKEESESVLGERPLKRGETWRFTRLNERMRFLRYGPGMFFACKSPFT